MTPEQRAERIVEKFQSRTFSQDENSMDWLYCEIADEIRKAIEEGKLK